MRLTHTEDKQGLYGRKGKDCKASVLLREGASGLVSTTVFYEGPIALYSGCLASLAPGR